RAPARAGRLGTRPPRQARQPDLVPDHQPGHDDQERVKRPVVNQVAHQTSLHDETNESRRPTARRCSLAGARLPGLAGPAALAAQRVQRVRSYALVTGGRARIDPSGCPPPAARAPVLTNLTGTPLAQRGFG